MTDGGLLESERSQDIASGRIAHDFLAQLVRTPSVNPGIYEAEVAQLIGTMLAPVAEVNYVETFPGRPSVAAVMQGQPGGPTIVLNGHMDTVPVDDGDGWSVDPFEAAIRDGFMFGRGTCDMKAGLAAQIAVAYALAPGIKDLRGRVILQFAVGEECGEPGTLSMCQAGYVGDIGVVTEPTELQISVATRGLLMFRVRIHGESIHASKAHLAINPVRRAGRILEAIERYEREVLERDHHLLGSGSCTPTVVRAGVKENAVADYCDLHFDRRLIPGETVEDELAAIRAVLEPLRADDPDLSFEVTASPYPFAPAEVAKDCALALALQRVAGEVLGTRPQIIGTAYSSDVRNLVNDAGMEAVTYGPGNVAECHCIDERVSLAQVSDAARVLTQLTREYLS